MQIGIISMATAAINNPGACGGLVQFLSVREGTLLVACQHQEAEILFMVLDSMMRHC